MIGISAFLIFREAFSCFHYSTADPKGSECVEKFAEMQKCMQQYPELFEKTEEPKMEEEEEEQAGAKKDAARAGEEEEEAASKVETPDVAGKIVSKQSS